MRSMARDQPLTSQSRHHSLTLCPSGVGVPLGSRGRSGGRRAQEKWLRGKPESGSMALGPDP